MSQSKTFTVELTIRATVTVTEEVREGIRNEIIDGFTNKTPAWASSDEEVAKRMVYASLNPRIAGWEFENQTEDDYWDGVANMKGLIHQISLETN